MEEHRARIWEKWHSVNDYLQVALEATLPTSKIPTFKNVEVADDFYVHANMDKMIHRAKAGETVDRYYHPRVGLERKPATRRIVMEKYLTNPLFYRVSLRRHAEERGTSVAMMWCGRASEGKAFGFSTSGSKNPFFVTLAYPGLTPEFEPVFIKVMQSREPLPYYLKVKARDEGENVVVTVTEIEKRQVPMFLAKEY